MSSELTGTARLLCHNACSGQHIIPEKGPWYLKLEYQTSEVMKYYSHDKLRNLVNAQ